MYMLCLRSYGSWGFKDLFFDGASYLFLSQSRELTDAEVKTARYEQEFIQHAKYLISRAKR